MLAKSLVFPKEKRDAWFERLKWDLQDAILARRNWWDDYQTGYMAYRSIPRGPKTRPWVNCSNIRPTITTQSVEQTVRRLVMFYVQSREYITLSDLSKVGATMGRARSAQELLRWQAEAELDYWNFVDSFVREYVTGGTGFGESDWVYDEEHVADVLVLGRDRMQKTRGGELELVPFGEPVTRKTPLKKIFAEVMGAANLKLGPHTPIRGGEKGVKKYHVRFKERGVEKVATVTIDRREDLGDEIQVMAEMPRVIKNQPIMRSMTAERVVVPPGDHDIQKAEWYAIKYYIPYTEVERRWKSGEWVSDESEKEAVRAQFKDSKGLPPKRDPGQSRGFSWEDEPGAQQDQDMYVGVDSERFRARQVLAIKMVRKWPIRKNPDELPCAQIWMLPRFNAIVRTHYDSVDNRSGMKNIISHHFIPARNEFYGISLPKLMQPVQEELDTVVNMQIDSLNITSMPMMFIDHSATMERDNLQYFPGATIRVNEPQQNVMFPQWPSRVGEFEVQIARLNAWGQDLSQQSAPQAVGRDPGTPSANRTARGAQLLLAERSFNINYSSASLARHIEAIWKQVYSWDAVHLPPGKEFQVLGSDEVLRINSRQDIRGDFNFRFEAGQAILNDEMRRALFTEAFQLTAPIAQAAPEQVPRPLWEMAREVWIQRGVKNPERFLPQPIDDPGAPMQPAEEHQWFALGRSLAVHPLDIDQVHIEQHMAFAASDDFGHLSPSALGFFQKHIEQHIRRVEAAKSAGQGSIGNTGVQMGGQLAMQGNPGINSSPGQPALTQPEVPMAPNGGG